VLDVREPVTPQVTGSSVIIDTRMVHTLSRQLDAFSSVLQQNPDFVIIGEMHGSKQNAPLLQKLLSAILAEPKTIAIAFEWALSTSEREALRAYIQGGETPTHLPAFFSDSDGRFTREHATLLKWIRAYNRTHGNLIDLHTFDDSSGNKEPDQAMADSLDAYKKQNPVSMVLVETGNMHARNSPYSFQGKEHLPMAAILKRDYRVFSIFLQYLQGEVDVEGESRDVTTATSQEEGPRTYFDAVIEIPVSEAAEGNDLTESLGLL